MVKANKVSNKKVESSAVEAPPAAPSLQDKQDVQLEFANLTEFRKSILEAIPRLQDNKYLRFVVTKHGEPAAVVMSYDAYQILQQATQESIDRDESLSREESLQNAYSQMQKEHWPESQPASADLLPLKSYIQEVIYEVLSSPSNEGFISMGKAVAGDQALRNARDQVLARTPIEKARLTKNALAKALSLQELEKLRNG